MARRKKPTRAEAATSGREVRANQQPAFDAVWQRFVVERSKPAVAYGHPCVRAGDATDSPLGLWVGAGYDREWEDHGTSYVLGSRRTPALRELAERLTDAFILALQEAHHDAVWMAFNEVTGLPPDAGQKYLNFGIYWAAKLGNFHGKLEAKLRALATQFDLSVPGASVSRAA